MSRLPAERRLAGPLLHQWAVTPGPEGAALRKQMAAVAWCSPSSPRRRWWRRSWSTSSCCHRPSHRARAALCLSVLPSWQLCLGRSQLPSPFGI